MDSMIALAATLFILSMINERIVNFVKLRFSGKTYYLFGTKKLKIHFGNLKEKSTDGEEDDRNLRLIRLNIIFGMVVSILIRADLICIMQHLSNPPEGLGWSNFNVKWDALTLLPGCFLTGCFLSLGSKFWHDLLDLLLYTKNLKGKLADDQTYTDITSADQLTEFLELTNSDMVRLAIEQNGTTLRTKFSNIQFLNDSLALVKNERKDVLGIYLTDDNGAGIPDKVPVKLPSGNQVSTEIIKGVGSARITGGMDGNLSNANLFGYEGSACCILHNDDSDNFLLTNCHVMTDGHVISPLYQTNNTDTLYDGQKIGVWHYGNMNPAGDIALIKLTDVDDFISNYNPEIFADQPRVITKDDWLKLAVTARGYNCKSQTGYVIETISNQLRVTYKDGIDITFKTAILIGDRQDKECLPITGEKDSGGAVYDSDMRLIGIITAVGDRYSYIIPINDFLNSFNLKLNKS